ncbi:hypothetical protein V1477_004753 [Vespula maculifrons]|uniref:Uncharacterized protein n=1 Tax=Vespula maculifrons TaxID=7453 RepID=A0ABD2CMQ1_VESMC
MDIEEAFRGFSIAVDLGTRLQQALLRRQPPQYPQRSRRELKGRVKTPRSNPASRQAWEPFSIQRNEEEGLLGGWKGWRKAKGRREDERWLGSDIQDNFAVE